MHSTTLRMAELRGRDLAHGALPARQASALPRPGRQRAEAVTGKDAPRRAALGITIEGDPPVAVI